ncbi:MAG: NapC/NirT family cytochrome c [Candidatus Rokuibacteriota bacterium]
MTDADMLRWGDALDWATVLMLGVSALILVCIAVSLVLYRGRQTEGSALWLHLLSLCVLPIGLLAVGNFVVLEHSKEVRFCGACHVVMKPYVDDLHKAGGESLAALHFQHRVAPGSECYSCHANYGLHGTFEAKLTGLRDVYRTYSHTYHVPIKMRTAFENLLCLKCHDGAKRFVAQEIHLDDGKVSAELRTGKMECTQCHGPAHEVARTRRAGGPGGSG